MKDQNTVSESYNVEDYMESVCDLEPLGLEDLESEGLEAVEDYQMEDYFHYIEGLSRADLITLLKWEIQNRLATEECMEELEERFQRLSQTRS